MYLYAGSNGGRRIYFQQNRILILNYCDFSYTLLTNADKSCTMLTNANNRIRKERNAGTCIH